MKHAKIEPIPDSTRDSLFELVYDTKSAIATTAKTLYAEFSYDQIAHLNVSAFRLANQPLPGIQTWEQLHSVSYEIENPEGDMIRAFFRHKIQKTTTRRKQLELRKAHPTDERWVGFAPVGINQPEQAISTNGYDNKTLADIKDWSTMAMSRDSAGRMRPDALRSTAQRFYGGLLTAQSVAEALSSAMNGNYADPATEGLLFDWAAVIANSEAIALASGGRSSVGKHATPPQD